LRVELVEMNASSVTSVSSQSSQSSSSCRASRVEPSGIWACGNIGTVSSPSTRHFFRSAQCREPQLLLSLLPSSAETSWLRIGSGEVLLRFVGFRVLETVFDESAVELDWFRASGTLCDQSSPSSLWVRLLCYILTVYVPVSNRRLRYRVVGNSKGGGGAKRKKNIWVHRRLVLVSLH